MLVYYNDVSIAKNSQDILNHHRRHCHFGHDGLPVRPSILLEFILIS